MRTTIHAVTRLAVAPPRRRCHDCGAPPWWSVSYTAEREDVRKLHLRLYCGKCLPESAKKLVGESNGV
jgi:hypothetical protein